MHLVTINRVGEWCEFYVDDEKLGGYGPTAYTMGSLRWMWAGAGRFGYCASREAAHDALSSLITDWRRSMALDCQMSADLARLRQAAA